MLSFWQALVVGIMNLKFILLLLIIDLINLIFPKEKKNY